MQMKLDKIGKELCQWGGFMFLGCGVGYHSTQDTSGAIIFWLIASVFLGFGFLTELAE